MRKIVNLLHEWKNRKPGVASSSPMKNVAKHSFAPFHRKPIERLCLQKDFNGSTHKGHLPKKKIVEIYLLENVLYFDRIYYILLKNVFP